MWPLWRHLIWKNYKRMLHKKMNRSAIGRNGRNSCEIWTAIWTWKGIGWCHRFCQQREIYLKCHQGRYSEKWRNSWTSHSRRSGSLKLGSRWYTSTQNYPGKDLPDRWHPSFFAKWIWLQRSTTDAVHCWLVCSEWWRLSWVTCSIQSSCTSSETSSCWS